MTSSNRRVLFALESSARFWPGEAPRPAQSAEINGHTFTIEFRLVNRKCYDGLQTPTVSIKVDGKRVSRFSAIAIATQGESQ